MYARSPVGRFFRRLERLLAFMSPRDPEAVRRLGKRCVADLRSREASRLVRSLVELMTYEPVMS